MRPVTIIAASIACLAASATMAAAQAPVPTPHDSVKTDRRARQVAYDSSAFAPGPDYGPQSAYDPQAQLDIYGAKFLNRTQRPLLEVGRELYGSGPFRPAPTPLGRFNILIPQLLVYGDLRTAVGQNGGTVSGGTWASRLNLDVDLQLTATERVHALLRPLERNGAFTRIDFGGDTSGYRGNYSAEPAALFFEGDLGAIAGGLIGRDSPFDMPIAAGLMPLLYHNGIWVEDAFVGAAATIPARHSKLLDWTNYDISVFYGANRVSNGVVGSGRDAGSIAGINTAIEAYRGYIEAGYARVTGRAAGGQDFHSIALSFTRRYRGRVSNSVRYVGAIGGSGGAGGAADGHLVLVESSLITSKPSTLVPYLNLFYGIDTPVSAARDPGAGGILKNTGIVFEPDALTGLPAIDARAQDAFGGALGVNILGNELDRQLVLEAGVTYPQQKSALLPGGQYAVGVRAQKNITNAIILRGDAIAAQRSGLRTAHGVRLELRHKF